jgi:hypothetical protein
MGPIRCPETSVKDYQSTLRNIPKERRSQRDFFSSANGPDRLWVPPTLLTSEDPEEGSVFLRIKRPGREADHWPSVEVENVWSCISYP